jgi:hypothetical protein
MKARKSRQTSQSSLRPDSITRQGKRSGAPTKESSPDLHDSSSSVSVTSLDRRKPKPIPHVSGIRPGVTSLQRLLVELIVASPIVPGEPVSFSWSVFTLFLPQDVGHVTARLYLVDDVDNPIFRNQNDGTPSPIFTVALADEERISPEDYQSRIYTFVPPLDQQNTIYAVNTRHFLRLELTGDGPQGGPFYSWSSELQVVYEAIDASWWVWDDEPQSVGWKTDRYTIGGQFTHKGIGLSVMTCNVDLRELDLTTYAPDVAYGPDDNPQPVAHGGTAAVKWGNTVFTKAWPWFLGFVDSINGETSKLFGYVVEISITDNFQNPYSKFVSSGTSVRVTVSDQKINAARGGEIAFAEWVALSALAIATSWIPGVGAAFGAGAGAALAINGGLSKIANDPPEPDPRYREPVTVEVPTIEPTLRALPQFRPLARFFELAQWIINSVDALGQIESRLLGAKADADNIAYSRQKAAYVATLAKTRDYTMQIEDAARQAASSLDMRKLASRSLLRRAERAVQGEGLLSALEGLLAHGQVDERLSLLASSAAQAPRMVPLFNELGRNLEAHALILGQLTLAIQRNAASILCDEISDR